MTGAENLEMDVAVRYSDYDTFGDTTNHKVGVKWQPVDNVLVRGYRVYSIPCTIDQRPVRRRICQQPVC